MGTARPDNPSSFIVMNRLAPQILMLTGDDDLVAAVDEASLRIGVRPAVDVARTIGAAHAALGRRSFDLCVVDVDPAEPMCIDFVRSITLRVDAPEIILILPALLSPETLRRIPADAEIVSRSRIGVHTLEQAVCRVLARLNLKVWHETACAERSGRIAASYDGTTGIPYNLRSASAGGESGSGTSGSGASGSGQHGSGGSRGGAHRGGHGGGKITRLYRFSETETPDTAPSNDSPGTTDPRSPAASNARSGGSTDASAHASADRGADASAEADSGLGVAPAESALIDAILETATSMIAILDARGTILRFNRKLELNSGYRAENVCGLPWWQLLPGGDEQRARVLFRAMVLSRRDRWEDEIQMMTRSGDLRVVAWSSRKFFNPDGSVACVICSGNDVTDQRATERSLRESNERFRTVIEHGSDDVTVVDANGNVKYENISVERITGYRPDELLGRSTFERIHPDDRETVRQGFLELASNPRATHTATYRYLHKSGHVIYLESVGTNLLDDPAVQGILINTRDVTTRMMAEQERRQAIDALRESEERYRAVAETASDAIVTFDAGGTILFVNDAATVIFGYPRDEMAGAPIELILPACVDHISRIDGAAGGSGSRNAARLAGRHRDGHEIPIEISLSRSQRGGRAIITGIARDVSERVEMEREREHLLELVNVERDRLTSVMKAIPGMVWESTNGPDGSAQHTSFVNDYVETLYGYTPEEWRSTPDFWLKVIHPEDLARLEKRAVDFAVRDEIHECYRVIRKDGRVIWLDVRLVIRRDENGAPLGTIGFAFDITDRKLMEQEREHLLELVNSERDRLTTIMRTTPGMIWETRTIPGARAQETIFVNDYVKTLYGYTPEELKRAPGFWIKTVHPEDRPALMKLLRGDESRNELHVTFRSIRKDGRVIWTDTRLLIHHDENGTPTGVTGFTFDVTDRKLMEQERERLLAMVNTERDRLDTMLRTIPGMIWETRATADSAIPATTFVNDYVETLYGYTVEEWKSEPAFWMKVVHPEDMPGLMTRLGTESPSNEIHDCFRGIRKDGRVIWVDVRLMINRDENGAPVSITGFTLDITDRMTAELALQRSERRYRSLVTAMAQIVWTNDVSGAGSSENNTWIDPSGKSDPLRSMQLVGDQWEAAIHPEDQEHVVAAWREALATSRQFELEFRLRAQDGTYRFVQARAVPVMDDAGVVQEWIGTCTDITEQRRNIQALRESEERLRIAIMNSPITVFNQDLDLTYTWVYNAALAEHPERSMVGRRDVDIVPSTVEAEAIVDMKREVLAEGRGVRREIQISMPRQISFFDMAVEPLKDDQGNVIGITGMTIDITDRKHAEMELKLANDLLEARVRERTDEIINMMAQIEEAYANQKRFVADASHDLRTPLTSLRAELDLLLLREDLEDHLRQALQRITGQARRLDLLTNDLLVLATLDARQTLNRAADTRIDDLVLESICHLSALAAEKNISWNIQFEEAIELTCEITSMRRALFNVLENATKYSLPDTVVDVILQQSPAEVRIVVTDRGIGIRKEDLPRIFERFYRGDRTRSTQGTGLGLAIVKAVIEVHGGTVEVESEPEQGTTVTIVLPRR